jgi:uncharacterized membrane protein YeaQ/YmgE (transglycosylase-associated protein family)
MGILENLNDLAKQFAAGTAPAADVHTAYDQVARTVPQSSLVEGLTHAFSSDQTPPFAQMISNLFNQSSPDQKAGLLNQIVATLGPGGVSRVLAGAGGMGGLGSVLSGGGSVTPAQAQQISPEQVQVLAQNAETEDLAGKEVGMHVIWWLIVGLIAGWLTGKIMGGPGGVLMDIIIGLVGALAGGFLMSLFGFKPEGGLLYTILVAVIGAVVLTWIYRQVTQRA